MKINTLTHKDAEWPKELNNTEPSVATLFYRGQIPRKPRVGIIGTRRPTSYGTEVVSTIVPELSRHGVCVVSGMALGIDSLAHKAALSTGGSTIAVLPSAIQKPYPARHSKLADKIANSGAVVSEYMSPQPIHAAHFIARNRIIAALSDVLLVVEAAHASGTMHTVRFALNMGKEVAAVPGPITHHYSSGTNQLIQDGAFAVTSARDVLFMMGISEETEIEEALEGTIRRLFDEISRSPASSSALAVTLKLPEAEVLSLLTDLELQKRIARRTDGMYARR